MDIMKLLIQRISKASVSIEGGIKAQVEKGLLIFAGFTHNDNEEKIEKAVNKIIGLRVFEDNEGKMNNSILDVKGKILLVSQFTLYGSLSKGKRPSFEESMNKDDAEILFNKLLKKFSKYIVTKSGIFGAYMQIALINDGPVTFLLEF